MKHGGRGGKGSKAAAYETKYVFEEGYVPPSCLDTQEAWAITLFIERMFKLKDSVGGGVSSASPAVGAGVSDSVGCGVLTGLGEDLLYPLLQDAFLQRPISVPSCCGGADATTNSPIVGEMPIRRSALSSASYGCGTKVVLTWPVRLLKVTKKRSSAMARMNLIEKTASEWRCTWR